MNLFSHDHLYARLKQRSGGKTRLMHRLGRDPLLDWAWMTTIAIALSGWFVISGFSAYDQVDRGISTAAHSPASTRAASFPVDDLKSVLSTFDSRQSLRISLQKAYTGPADPSL